MIKQKVKHVCLLWLRPDLVLVGVFCPIHQFYTAQCIANSLFHLLCCLLFVVNMISHCIILLWCLWDKYKFYDSGSETTDFPTTHIPFLALTYAFESGGVKGKTLGALTVEGTFGVDAGSAASTDVISKQFTLVDVCHTIAQWGFEWMGLVVEE